MKIILDFCATCGVLITESHYDGITCRNCGESIEHRDKRIQGEFEESEAAKLKEINFG